jgi:peptidoglycan/LPS O-acetylase OafA/YrhL
MQHNLVAQRDVAADTAVQVEKPIGIRRSAQYLYEIESLRGIAMLLVFMHHVNARVMGPLPPGEAQDMTPLWAFVRAGHTGVSLFFVLSGFLLSLPFLAEAAGGRRTSARQFFIRRALRILPLYYVAVLIGTVLSASAPRDLLRGIPHLLFLTYIPGWGVGLFPYSATWWSLSTEVQYYLVLPVLPLLLMSRLGRWIGAALLVTYTAAYVTHLSGYWGMPTMLGNMAIKYSLFGRAPLFLCGILVAWVYLRGGDRLRPRLQAIAVLSRGGADFLLVMVVVALGILLRWTLRQGYSMAEATTNFAWHIPEGLAWAAILALVILAPLRLKPLIANPLFGYLGILSYSMYLWHTAVLNWVPVAIWKIGWRWTPGWNPTTLINSALVAVIALGISQLTYTFIERPFLARKARIE